MWEIRENLTQVILPSSHSCDQGLVCTDIKWKKSIGGKLWDFSKLWFGCHFSKTQSIILNFCRMKDVIKNLSNNTNLAKNGLKPGHWYVFTCRPDFSYNRQCNLVPRSILLNTPYLAHTKSYGYGYGNQTLFWLLHDLDTTIYVLPIYICFPQINYT